MKCLVVFLAVLALSSARPAGFFDDDDDFFKGFDFKFPSLHDIISTIPKVDCQSLGCPRDSNSCSKKVATSEDKKKIITTVKCFLNGKEIDEQSTSNPNPDPNAQVSEYSFYGSYSGDNTSINIENHTGNAPGGDNIETFDR